VRCFALKRVLWAVHVLLVCVTLLFGLMRAIGGSPLRHGPPLGLSNEAWVKYSDPKPDSTTQRRLALDMRGTSSTAATSATSHGWISARRRPSRAAR
jgi:hypothetical protein